MFHPTRNINQTLPINSFNLCLTTKDSLRNTKIKVCVDIIILPLKIFITSNLNLYYQISRPSTVFSLVTTASHSEILTCVNTFGNTYLLLLCTISCSTSMTGSTRISNLRSFSLTSITLHLNLHWTLSEINCSTSFTSTTLLRFRARFTFTTFTSLTCIFDSEFNFLF